jgi:DNA-binding CsgD family transcriptional regulator
LDGWALLITEGYAAATPMLKQALTALRSDHPPRERGLRLLWLAGRSAVDLWDHESWDVLSGRAVQVAREAGALTALQTALISRFLVHLLASEFATAASNIEEIDAITEATGIQLAPYAAVVLAAWKGHEADTTDLIQAATKEWLLNGEGQWLTVTQWSSAVLYNGLGRYEEAFAAAHTACEDRQELGVSIWALSELVEAASRTSNSKPGTEALERIFQATRFSQTDWGLGIGARSRALLSGNDLAEDLYVESVDRLGRTRIRVELARAHLLYGEWLRRQHRRLEAREQLHTAREMFMWLGMEAFGARAARELRASGGTARKRTIETSDQLTSREAQIAQFASAGLSNPEISARLFLSRRTVEYHMHNVFSKLEISSRSQLPGALSAATGTDQQSTPQA